MKKALILILVAVLLLSGGCMQLVPKRKALRGVVNNSSDSKVAAGTETIASSVAYLGGYTLNTVYFNATPRILLVMVSVLCASANAGEQSYIVAYSDTTNPPTKVYGSFGVSGASVTSIYGCLSFPVLPSHYYKITTTKTGNATTPALISWVELTIRN